MSPGQPALAGGTGLPQYPPGATNVGTHLVGHTGFTRHNPMSDRFPIYKYHHVEFWTGEAGTTAKRCGAYRCLHSTALLLQLAGSTMGGDGPRIKCAGLATVLGCLRWPNPIRARGTTLLPAMFSRWETSPVHAVCPLPLNLHTLPSPSCAAWRTLPCNHLLGTSPFSQVLMQPCAPPSVG